MMKTFLTIFCLVSQLPILTGQTLKEAHDLFRQERYSEALPVFMNELRSDSFDISLNYSIAVCYMHSRSGKIKALGFFEKAVRSAERSGSLNQLPDLVYKYLGDIYQFDYEFDKAIMNYEKYKAVLNEHANPDTKELEETGWKIDMCRVGKALNGLTNVSIDLKKDKANKNPVKQNTFSSSLSPDQSKMTFTFNRAQKGEKINDEPRYFEDVDIPVVNIPADTVKPEKKNKNQTTIATSFDGQIVLNYRDDNGTANLYATCLNGNTWTVPEKLNKPLNHSGWEESEYISADGRLMVFVSDRKGGFGGKDIYMCRKNSDNEWGKAENLGPVVNTSRDDEAPFIHPDGHTLYYSSNGKQNTGKFGIYTTVLSGNQWSEPVSVGFPIDSTQDLQPLPEVVKQTIPEKVRKKKRSKLVVEEKISERRDNYLISFTNPNGEPLTLLKGEFLFGQGQEPGPVKIILRNNESGETNSMFFSDSASGKYSMILPPGCNNNITYRKEGYMIFSENVDLKNRSELFEKRERMQLFKPEEGATIVLNNVFFENGSASLKPISMIALNDILDFLKKFPNAVVEFENTIVSKEKMKINTKLSRERAEALVKHFTANGINEERLIAKGTAIKPKHAPDKKRDQWVEMRIVENNITKELLTTQ
jgi:outer membrane protein OmpA-like peptidoglycan-associated protein